MIRIEETVHVDRSPEEAFAFLADFRNLPRWDPGIVVSEKTDGPDSVGVGTGFEVVASFLGRRIPMTYRVTVHDPVARRAVLVGRAATLTATDDIEVLAAPGGSRVRWRADFAFVGPLRFTEPLMKPLMVRLGRDAMSGLVRALGGRRIPSPAAAL